MTSQEATRPKWRWFQFGLRTMLVVITVVCVLFGTVYQRIQNHLAAVKLLQSHGDTEVKFHPPPAWLFAGEEDDGKGKGSWDARRGYEWARDVRSVKRYTVFDDETVSSADHAKALANFPRMTEFGTLPVGPTNLKLDQWRCTDTLEDFSWHGSSFFGLKLNTRARENLVHLARFRRLKSITLGGVRGSDQPITRWSELKDVKSIYLTDVSAVDMEGMVDWTNLEGCSINGANDVPAPLWERFLATKKGLKFLSLEKWNSSPQVFDRLAECNELGVVFLGECAATDGDIRKLSRLPELMMFDIGRSNVTAAAFERNDLNDWPKLKIVTLNGVALDLSQERESGRPSSNGTGNSSAENP